MPAQISLKMFFGYKLEDTGNPLYSHLLRWNNSNHIKKHFSDSIKASVNGYDPLEESVWQITARFQ